MITPDDLIDFATFDLADIPTEAAARRAVSASYYAVFHAIAWAGAGLFNGSEQIRQKIARSYDHGKVVDTIEKLSRQRTNVDLAMIAQGLRRLREARERADYELIAEVTWADAGESIFQAVELVGCVNRLKSDPALAELLVLPLLRDSKHRG